MPSFAAPSLRRRSTESRYSKGSADPLLGSAGFQMRVFSSAGRRTRFDSQPIPSLLFLDAHPGPRFGKFDRSMLRLLDSALGDSDQETQGLVDGLGVGKGPSHILRQLHGGWRSLSPGSARNNWQRQKVVLRAQIIGEMGVRSLLHTRFFPCA